MAYLELAKVSKGFGPPSQRTAVLADVELAVDENEFVAILGFSGSGKSTLVGILAGLIDPDEGDVMLANKVVVDPGPERGVMFQNYSLLPWLTVEGNIALAVRKVMPGLSRVERAEYVQRYVDMVNLTGSEAKCPDELSGGMRQRASLARTLAMRPNVLLLDEPLSALDALTRANLQDEIVRIWEEDKRTVVMITNDVDEAALMADRIIVLTPGPRATLGPSFDVDLPRPRDRAGLNRDRRFQALRKRITGYMLNFTKTQAGDEARSRRRMPAIEPRVFEAA